MRDIEVWEVVGLHAAVFGISLAEARDRVHDLQGLEAAVVRPANYRHYQDADLTLQAAALAHGIAERQVFIDGNKRTAVLSMLYFLENNGHVLSATEDQLFDWMIRLAHGWGAQELGDAVRPTLKPLGPSKTVRPLTRHRRQARTVSGPAPSGLER